MFCVILADAQLELVPLQVHNHPAVRNHARLMGRRPSMLLLDQNSHGAATKGLEEGARRGRPDIVHIALLQVLESPVARTGRLQLGIHTRNGEWVRVRADTRLPRGEARFHGLMAKVLTEGKSNEGDPLVWSEGQKTPQEIIQSFAKGRTVRLDPDGPITDVDDLVDEDVTLVIGGFAQGSFSDAWKQATPEAASIWPEELNVWTVATECLAAYRRRWVPTPPGSTDPR